MADERSVGLPKRARCLCRAGLAMLGTWLLGRTAVPLNYLLSEDELDVIRNATCAWNGFHQFSERNDRIDTAIFDDVLQFVFTQKVVQWNGSTSKQPGSQQRNRKGSAWWQHDADMQILGLLLDLGRHMPRPQQQFAVAVFASIINDGRLPSAKQSVTQNGSSQRGHS